jgi:hypothetical protein
MIQNYVTPPFSPNCRAIFALIKYLALSKFSHPNDELDGLSMSDPFDGFSKKLEQNKKKKLKTFFFIF